MRSTSATSPERRTAGFTMVSVLFIVVVLALIVKTAYDTWFKL